MAGILLAEYLESLLLRSEMMITERIARYVAEIETGDIPDRALQVARSAIMDYAGVTLAGSKEETARIISEFAGSMGGSGNSSVIGGGFKTSPFLASLANGTAGHALDFDDGGSFGHCSVVLAPAILAVGEFIGASGKDILSAYVVGFESVYHLHSVVGSPHYARGWHGSSTTGSLAATAAVAWLLKLDSHQTRMALGIAASLAGGLRQNFGTMTKPLHAGDAASNGVKAALLAKAGFTADENIIEAHYGFARVLGYESEIDWARASESLGKSFTIIVPATGAIHFKLYPSCAETHASIDAALALRDKHHPDPDAIKEVELGVNGTEKTVLIHHRPRNGLEGKFSLEYTVARALLSGEVRIRDFSDTSVDAPDVSALIEKMKWVEKYPPPRPGSRKTFGPNSVTVILRDGKEYYQEALSARGSRQNPVTDADLQSKYRDCASLVLMPDDVDRSRELLNKLEEVKDIRDLMDVISKH